MSAQAPPDRSGRKGARQFYETYIVKLINEAEKLDISQEEILQMIRSGRKDGIEP